jgi:hypothetical protein
MLVETTARGLAEFRTKKVDSRLKLPGSCAQDLSCRREEIKKQFLTFDQVLFLPVSRRGYIF